MARRLPESTMVSISSDHDLVERILHDPLAPRRFDLRNQIADRAFLDDRIDGDPVGIAQRRDRRPLKRGSSASTFSRSRRRIFSIRPTRPCASMAARSSSAMFSICALPLIRQR